MSSVCVKVKRKVGKANAKKETREEKNERREKRFNVDFGWFIANKIASRPALLLSATQRASV